MRSFIADMNELIFGVVLLVAIYGAAFISAALCKATAPGSSERDYANPAL